MLSSRPLMQNAHTSEKQKAQPKRRERGEGHLYRRGNLWWFKYYVRGQEIRESSRSATKQVAVEILQERLKEVRDGGARPHIRKITYTQMRDRLYEDFRLKGHKSLLTHKDGKPYIGPVPALDRFFEGYKAQEIDTSLMKKFIAERQKAGVSNSGINGSLRILRRMFRLQHKENGYPVNLIPFFPLLPADKPRKDFLTQQQYEKVLAELPGDLQPLFICSYFTGARRSELLRLTWADIDMQGGFIRFEETKNDEPREVPFIGPMRKTLEAQRAKLPKAKKVFVWADGSPIRSFKGSWKSALDKAGLAGHLWHGNRRSQAVNLMASGVDEQLAMELTGHRDRDTFRRYRQLVREAKLAAAQKLNQHLGVSE